VPILNIKVCAARSREMTRKISTVLSDLTKRILGKDPHVTSIAIEYVDPVTRNMNDFARFPVQVLNPYKH